MKQPDDKKTIELNLGEVKRGRGRPSKPDALSPAERAKRYRDAKRDLGKLMPAAIKRDETVTKNMVSNAEMHEIMQGYNDDIDAQRTEIADLRKQLEHHIARRDEMFIELERARGLVQSLRTEAAEAKASHLSVLTRLMAIDPTGKKEAAAEAAAKKRDAKA